jgi:general secretion pathway protein D
MNKKQKTFSNILTCMICVALLISPIYGANEVARSRLRKRKTGTQESLNQLVDANAAQMGTSETGTIEPQPKEAFPDSLKPMTNRNDAAAKTKTVRQLPYTPMDLAASHETSAHKKQKTDSAEPEEIEFYFENASLQNLIAQIEEIFDITFITDDILDPLPKDGKTIKGNKISFKTHKPLTKKQAWNLFVTFLDIAGFNIVPMPEPKMYRIQKFQSVLKAAIRSYIGVDPESLPEDEEIIRYVYFIENSTVEAITPIVNSLKGAGAELVALREHRAFILTDKAYNIKMLMKIVKELDQVSMPQSMSVLKLRRTDALEVKKLYDSLIHTEEKQDYASRLFASRKQPTSSYFPENTRIIAEPRTNALILLGSQDAIKKIEDFIIKNVDVDISVPYPRLQPIKLKYADAATVAEILTSLTKFGSDTPAGKSGGVRGGDKYLKAMTFTPVRETNTLIIQGDYEDYLQVVEIVKQLDEPQPQIAVEVLVISITNNNTKQLGTQLRTKVPGSTQGFLGNNVVFQTSGFLASGTPSPVIENTSATLGVQRLLGNLASLANSAIQGNTLLTLGADAFGVWGIFNVLQTITDATVISNPFMIVTNKAEAKIEIGQIRRIVEAQIIPSAGDPQTSQKDDSAVLSVTITPQINASDGKIILDIRVVQSVYTEPASGSPTAGNKNIKDIITSTMVADGEVLALGGITRNTINHTLNKVPILGDIPVLGWLFKNKQVTEVKETLLILFNTRIIESDSPTDVNKFTQEKIADYHATLANGHDISEAHDPIYNMFFAEKRGSVEATVDDFIFERAQIKGSAGASIDKKIKHKKRAALASGVSLNLESDVPIIVGKPGCCADGIPLAPRPRGNTCCPDPLPNQNSFNDAEQQIDALEPTRQKRATKKRKKQKALADYLPNESEARA